MIMIVMMNLYSYHVKKHQYFKEINEMIKLNEELKNWFKQSRVDDVTTNENREIKFEPIT